MTKDRDAVHVLTYGVSLCQEPKGLPASWPRGQRWVRPADFAAIPLAEKCPNCKQKMAIDGARIIRMAEMGKESLRQKNPCPAQGCVLMGTHFGDHERADGTKFSVAMPSARRRGTP